jgi:DNA-3-methyladenine glycosylase II
MPTTTFRHTKRHRDHLTTTDPILGKAIELLKLRKRELRPDTFDSLARSIIGQQLSVKAAASIFIRVQMLFPKSQPFPTPVEFLKMSASKLRKAGLSKAKVDYIRNLANFMIKHQAEFAAIDKLTDEEVIELLTQVKGIGRWTAEMFLMFSLGRQDVFSYGDLGLRAGMMKIYKLRKMPSVRRAKEISDKWKPYRTHASMYLWQSLNNE